MNYNNDPYETGTPKYSTATDIYEKLCEMYYNEEASVLGEMFPDISYDNQEYYYTDKGMNLKEQFDKLSDFGNKMWIMDIAAWQIEDMENEYGAEIHDFVFECLNNDDMAKRIGFKKLFIDILLDGEKQLYDIVSENFEAELRELNRFGWYENGFAFNNSINTENHAWKIDVYRKRYGDFSSALYKKFVGLQLTKETHLIAECRAFLTSYDDFILGLKINQTLYAQQEQQYNSRMAALKADYEEKVRQLLAVAQSQGVVLELPIYETNLLEGATV